MIKSTLKLLFGLTLLASLTAYPSSSESSNDPGASATPAEAAASPAADASPADGKMAPASSPSPSPAN